MMTTGSAPRPIFAGDEGASEQRLLTQHVEEVGGDPGALRLLGRGVVVADVDRAEDVRANAGERLRLRRQSSRSGSGRRQPAAARRPPRDRLQLVRRRSKLKPRMNAALMMVKPTVLAPMPSAIAAIAAAENQRSLIIKRDAKRRSWPRSSRKRNPRTSRCCDCRDVAPPSRSAACRSLRRASCPADVVFGRHLEMRRHLLREVAIELAAAKKARSRAARCRRSPSWISWPRFIPLSARSSDRHGPPGAPDRRQAAIETAVKVSVMAANVIGSAGDTPTSMPLRMSPSTKAPARPKTIPAASCFRPRPSTSHMIA